MSAQHHLLLDICGTRGARYEIDGARQASQLPPGEVPGILHVGNDSRGRDDGDVGLGQQTHCRRGLRTGHQHQRPGLGKRGKCAGHPHRIQIIRTARRKLESCGCPVNVSQSRPDATAARQLQGLKIFCNHPRQIRFSGNGFSGALTGLGHRTKPQNRVCRLIRGRSAGMCGDMSVHCLAVDSGSLGATALGFANLLQDTSACRIRSHLVHGRDPDQTFSATRTSSSIFLASPNSIRLLSL